MHNLLLKLLNKRNLKLEELSQEEKSWFDEKQKILSEGEITVEKLATFCESQINLIQEQFKDFKNDSKTNDRLIIAFTIYSTLLKAIKSPAVEREVLEKYLIELTK